MYKLFLTGFLQVLFVAANTYFIATSNWKAIALCGFAISWLWSGNIKKVAFGGTKDRIVYSLGAASGSICGALLAKLL